MNKEVIIEKNFALAIDYHKKNNLKKAIKFYNEVLIINPNHLLSLKNLSIIFISQKEYQNAKNCYEKVIKINFNHADVHNNLGVIYKLLEENQKAKVCYEKAIEINPDYADAHNNLGIIFKSLGENQKAKVSYEKAIEINPNNGSAHNNLGIIFQELEENQKAKASYEKAIEINPNNSEAYNNLGTTFKLSGEIQKAKASYEKAIEINPNYKSPYTNLTALEISNLNNFEKILSISYKYLSISVKNRNFFNHSIPIFRLKHDVQQAEYLISKDYKITGINQFRNTGNEILSRKENKNEHTKSILLRQNEVNALLPFFKSHHIYQPKKNSVSCINPNKNWKDVEDEYFSSPKQIIYIDDFLSNEVLNELREFCLVSKVWNKEYKDKYLGAFSDEGFVSPIHLQIAADLKQKLPKLFGPYKIEKFWGFKYDTALGKGINIHADFAIHNLNFWITPDQYNNNKNSGGLKVYDVPAPDNWNFKDYNTDSNKKKIYKFLKDNNANCTNVPYKFNRAVLFNSAYFHETDEIDFKDKYEGRRINNTYLFGDRKLR